MSIDAFGRLRTSNPITLYDANNVGHRNPLIDISGGFTYDYSASTVLLDSSGNRSSIAQSRYISPYQPGKSLLIYTSFAMSNSLTSVERVGYFNANNGVFFEKLNGVYSFVIRNEGVENRVNQSQWNIRKLLTGKIILDASKVQIFWCDIEWLGVGSVLCGFCLNRELIACHRFDHANSATATYMKQAKLPIRYEITEAGQTQKSLKEICSCVSSEGGYELRSMPRSVGSGSITVGTGIWPISIRLSPAHIDDTVVIPSSMIVYSSASENQPRAIRYEVMFNPTVSGNAVWNDISDSAVQYSTTTSFVNGTLIRTGYTEAQDSVILNSSSEFNIQLGRRINGTSDILAVKITNLVSSSSAAAALTWYEI